MFTCCFYYHSHELSLEDRTTMHLLAITDLVYAYRRMCYMIGMSGPTQCTFRLVSLILPIDLLRNQPTGPISTTQDISRHGCFGVAAVSTSISLARVCILPTPEGLCSLGLRHHCAVLTPQLAPNSPVFPIRIFSGTLTRQSEVIMQFLGDIIGILETFSDGVKFRPRIVL